MSPWKRNVNRDKKFKAESTGKEQIGKNVRFVKGKTKHRRVT